MRFSQKNAQEEFNSFRATVVAVLAEASMPIGEAVFEATQYARTYTELQTAIFSVMAYLDNLRDRRGVTALVSQLNSLQGQTASRRRELEAAALGVEPLVR